MGLPLSVPLSHRLTVRRSDRAPRGLSTDLFQLIRRSAISVPKALFGESACGFEVSESIFDLATRGEATQRKVKVSEALIFDDRVKGVAPAVIEIEMGAKNLHHRGLGGMSSFPDETVRKMK